MMGEMGGEDDRIFNLGYVASSAVGLTPWGRALAVLGRVPPLAWIALVALIAWGLTYCAGQKSGAQKAKTAVVIANIEGRAETNAAQADVNKAAAIRSDKLNSDIRKIDHDSEALKRAVAQHPAADQPIDPALAREWLDGLRRLRGEPETGPDAGLR